MKYLLTLIFLILLTAPNIRAQSETLYGITASGDIYIKESLVDACGVAGETIQVGGDFNKWQYQNMVLIDKDHNLSTTDDGYYLLRTGERFKMSRKVTFVIRINEETWFPQCGLDKSLDQLNSYDCVSNGNDGHNLNIKPNDIMTFD